MTQMRMTYLTEITGIFHMVGKDILDQLLKDHEANVTRANNLTDTEIIHNLLEVRWGGWWWRWWWWW